MYTFLATCKDDTGREVVERVDAADLAEARTILEERGYAEIVFETDPELYPSADTHANPELDRQIRRTGVVPWSVWLKVWALNLSPFLAWNAWSWWQGPPFGVFDWIGFALTACVAAGAFLLGLPLHLYQSLLAASAWHRWDRVLRLAPRLGAIGRLTSNRQLEFDAAVRSARALIGLGRKAEAFQRVGAFRPSGQELGRIADLHWAAGDRALAIELQRQTTEALPDKADSWIDYAGLLFRDGDFASARRAMERARRYELTAIAQCFAARMDGVLALETGELATAVERLETAIRQLAALESNPITEACGLYWRGHLVLALAAAGRGYDARAAFDSCRVLLHAIEEHELLERCANALDPSTPMRPLAPRAPLPRPAPIPPVRFLAPVPWPALPGAGPPPPGRLRAFVQYPVSHDLLRVVCRAGSVDVPSGQLPPALCAAGAELALDVAADGSITGVAEMPALVRAAAKNDFRTLSELLREPPDARRERDLADAIFEAAALGCRESLEVLIEAGAPLDGGRADGLAEEAPLFRAIDDHDLDLARRLIDAGARADVRSEIGTLLHAAIDAEMIEWTDLHRDGRPLSARFTELLLEHGADDSLRDADGRDALEYAHHRHHTLAADLIAQHRARRRGDS